MYFEITKLEEINDFKNQVLYNMFTEDLEEIYKEEMEKLYNYKKSKEENDEIEETLYNPYGSISFKTSLRAQLGGYISRFNTRIKREYRFTFLLYILENHIKPTELITSLSMQKIEKILFTKKTNEKDYPLEIKKYYQNNIMEDRTGQKISKKVEEEIKGIVEKHPEIIDFCIFMSEKLNKDIKVLKEKYKSCYTF